MAPQAQAARAIVSTAVRLERGQACATVSAATLLLPSVIDYLPITVTRGYGEDESSKVSQMPKRGEVFRTARERRDAQEEK